MPRYVVLYRFTDEGRKAIREAPRRWEQIRKLNELTGFEVLGHYWTQGRFDIISIVEAPSEEAMTLGLMSINAHGHVVSETLRAFTDEEMEHAIGPMEGGTPSAR